MMVFMAMILSADMTTPIYSRKMARSLATVTATTMASTVMAR